MPRRKQTRRRRQSTPRPTAWRPYLPDELDEFLDALDIEDELDELEMMFGDEPAPGRPGYRPVVTRRGDLVGSPLARAWADRVGDCGAGVARLARGLDYLVSGAVLDLQVREAQIAAVVQGTRRYRVVVDLVLPPKADRQAALERVQHARAAALPGSGPQLAVQNALVAGGSHLFPSYAQLGPECSCPDGAPCKHAVATILGFGVLLSREPELLFALWGYSRDEVRTEPIFTLPPLAMDKRPLADPLDVAFGIDLLVSPQMLPPETDDRAPRPPSAPAEDTVDAVDTAPTDLPPVATGDMLRREDTVVAVDTAPAASASLPPCEQPEVQRDYLRVLGLPARTIDNWLRTGVLRPTDRKDTYERTPEANRRIASFLAR